MATRNVIIGGGPVGTYAVDTIRRFDPGASITLISDEPAYSRMALPYFLSSEVPEEQMWTASPDYFRRQRVEAVIGERVVALDPQSRTVRLPGGREVGFDNLLIATGAQPNRIAVPGADSSGVTPLWTIADARAALERISEGAAVCLVGAGFIGLIILNALYKRGCQLTLVEIAGQVLPRMLDPDAAACVLGWLTSKGVTVLTNEQVTEIAGAERKSVRLGSGTSLEADLVVLATGVTPNVELAREAGIAVRSGIVIDNRCQTSLPGIYAGGDCAEGPDLVAGGTAIHAIQPTAADHGRVAGANMAGRGAEYPGSLSMNILDVCGLQCASFGDWLGQGLQAQVTTNPPLPLYRKLVWRDSRLVGAIFVGPMNDVCMLNDVGMAKGMIQTAADLSDWKDYLRENPADLRRPYVGAGVPARLAEFQLLGAPSEARGFRYQDRQPGTDPGPSHATLVGTRGG